MTSDISLTGAQRLALIDLKNNANLSSRTQRRLSSGRQINSVVDDSVNYFKAKSLEDRSKDFANLKSEIGQAISHLQVTLEAITGLETILGQMKGILEASRSQSQAERGLANKALETLGTQFKELVNDASYGGANLINSTSQGRTVRFGLRDSSKLELPGLNFINGNSVGSPSDTANADSRVFDDKDMFSGDNLSFNIGVLAKEMTQTKVTGATIENAVTAGGVFDKVKLAGFTNSASAEVPPGTILAENTDNTKKAAVRALYGIPDDAAANGTDPGISITTIRLVSVENAAYTHVSNYTGDTVDGVHTGDIDSAAAAPTAATPSLTGTITLSYLENGIEKTTKVAIDNSVASTDTAPKANVTGGNIIGGKTTGVVKDTSTGFVNTTEDFVGLTKIGADNQNVSVVDAATDRLEAAISRLRGHAQSLGSNVAILQARESFTETYVTMNVVGSEKYTLAELNQEGANLVALQTRQQLGIQALAVAGQQQRAILTLLQ